MAGVSGFAGFSLELFDYNFCNAVASFRRESETVKDASMSAKPLPENLDYHVWLADALSSGQMGIGMGMSDKQLLGFVTRFNHEIDATIQQHGENTVADSIWFIYGCVSDYMRDVLDPSLGRLRIDFMNSVKTLYAEGFNRHCVPDFANEDALNSACYMLWDMDGIDCPVHSGDVEMLKASLDVLTFALTLKNPACHKSALHGLGHLVLGRESVVQPVIRDYLRANPPEPQREYAKAAFSGCIQ
jgi:hypothetical protein